MSTHRRGHGRARDTLDLISYLIVTAGTAVLGAALLGIIAVDLRS